MQLPIVPTNGGIFIEILSSFPYMSFVHFVLWPPQCTYHRRLFEDVLRVIDGFLEGYYRLFRQINNFHRCKENLYLVNTASIYVKKHQHMD
jgi:hypothetical protein